jgi:hypothetical protein
MPRKSIGEVRFGELESLHATLATEVSLLQKIRNDLQRMIRKASEAPDAA